MKFLLYFKDVAFYESVTFPDIYIKYSKYKNQKNNPYKCKTFINGGYK